MCSIPASHEAICQQSNCGDMQQHLSFALGENRRPRVRSHRFLTVLCVNVRMGQFPIRATDWHHYPIAKLSALGVTAAGAIDDQRVAVIFTDTNTATTLAWGHLPATPAGWSPRLSLADIEAVRVHYPAIWKGIDFFDEEEEVATMPSAAHTVVTTNSFGIASE
jgi:hypothetical protein